ncbi:F0F1 ATP synthase subunit A [Fulvivirga maritima]|uniref:F0F1 ATP synthase subunit A n=1 Tax=Fulvivirga maritima TaxID=2904247 RepID=UPI001F2D2298|nr:F0F1 ATP synthase subunit A [Fulvivirga maritima]UII28503.1 F0F1 ATP synthase subunit A [Fulvivirga maritima]
MIKKNTAFFTLLVILFASSLAFGSNDEEAGHSTGGAVDTKEEIDEYIHHHLRDSHDFTLFTLGESGTHIGFPLPVILWDDGLHVFMSSKFHHDTEVAESNGNYYAVHHGKIYKTNAEGHMEYDEHHHPTNPTPLDLSITKNVVGMIFAGLLLLLMFGSLAKSYKNGPIPTGVGRFLEPLVIYVRDEMARPNIGEKHYQKFMPYLLTAFFYIWILNLMGMTPLGFNVTGNIAVTVCLALFTFFIVQFSGNKDYWKHIFWMPGVPVPMKIILMPIEIIGMFTKPFALLIRLFANMTAGHFVVMSLIALSITMKAAFGPAAAMGMSFFLALFISIIELLVAFLQAYIFTMLSALFIGMAIEEHH